MFSACLTGNAGNDPKHIPSKNGGYGLSIVSVADDVYESSSTTQWHRCVFMGKLAKVASDLIKKGSKITALNGRLVYFETEKEGVKISIPQLVFDSFRGSLLEVHNPKVETTPKPETAPKPETKPAPKPEPKPPADESFDDLTAILDELSDKPETEESI